MPMLTNSYSTVLRRSYSADEIKRDNANISTHRRSSLPSSVSSPRRASFSSGLLKQMESTSSNVYKTYYDLSRLKGDKANMRDIICSAAQEIINQSLEAYSSMPGFKV